MKNIINFIFVALLAFSSFANAENPEIVEFYKERVNIYDATGKKLKKIDSSQILKDKPIYISDVNKKGLVAIEFSGRQVWVRLSSLKLSRPIGPCPTTRVSKKTDYTSPSSSGLGDICEK